MTKANRCLTHCELLELRGTQDSAHVDKSGLYGVITDLEDDIFICKPKVPSKPLFERLLT